ncbi:hypothetical protein V4B17_02535 [Bartonella sp. B23]
MRLTRKVILMCVLILSSGYLTNGCAACVGWIQIYLEKQYATAISSNLARDILKHNQQGERLCRWKHGKKNIEKITELTESEKEMLQEMIVIYQNVK